MYKIHNDIFCLSIKERGAELEEVSIHGINILWKGKELWNAQSPLLFPVIGSLKDGYYLYNQQKYVLNPHGFIKDQVFDIVEKTSNSITLKSSYTEETYKVYPFIFEFYITYTLLFNKIKISIEIKNLEQKTIYFSLGLHPGLDYAGLKELIGEDLYLQMNVQQEVQAILFDPVYMKNTYPTKLSPSVKLSEFSKELIEKRTICYQGVQEIELGAETKKIKIKHSMPFTAFWQSRPEDPKFICVEPWYGLPDECITTHQLEKKKEIISLEARGTFKTELEISYLEGAESYENYSL